MFHPSDLQRNKHHQIVILLEAEIKFNNNNLLILVSLVGVNTLPKISLIRTFMGEFVQSTKEAIIACEILSHLIMLDQYRIVNKQHRNMLEEIMQFLLKEDPVIMQLEIPLIIHLKLFLVVCAILQVIQYLQELLKGKQPM